MSQWGLDKAEALDQLRTHLDQAEEGVGRMITITSASSAMCQVVVDELVDLAKHRGMRILTARGSLTEQHLMGGVLDQLFKCADPERDVLLELGELGLVSSEDWATQRPLTAGSARVAHAFAREFMVYAHQSPLVILVEDANYTDLASQHVLTVLGRRISGTSILSVACLFSYAGGVANTHFTMAGRHITSLLLAPPTTADVEELIKLAQPQFPVNCSEVHALTGGDPQLLSALMEDASVAKTCEEIVPGPSFDRAIVARLHAMGPEVMGLARCLAIAGEGASKEILARATGMRVSEVQRHVRLLEQVGLVSNGSFRHPAVPRALIDTLSSDERAEIRLVLARTLFDRGAESMQIARYLIDDRQDLEYWSVSCLLTASRRALASGDLSFAAACAEEISRCDQSIAGELVQLTIAGRTTPTTIVPQLEFLLHALEEGQLNAQDAALVVKMCLWAGQRRQAACARATMAELGLLSDPWLQVQLWAAYALYCGFDTDGDYEGWLLPPSANDPWSAWIRDLSRNHAGNPRNIELLLTSSVVDDSSIEVIVMMIATLIAEGQYGSAHRWATQSLVDAHGLGSTRWEAVLLALRAACLLHQGFVVDAAEAAAEAMESISIENWGSLVFMPLVTLVEANAHLGRHVASERLLKYHDAQRVSGFHLASLMLARGRHSAATGRRLAAIADYYRCRDILATCTPVPALENLVPWRLDLAEVHIELGRSTVAVQLVREHLEQVKGHEEPAQGRAALLLALCRSKAERRPALEKAVTQLESSGDHLVLADGLKALAACCQEMGDLERARLLLRRVSRERRYCQLEPEETRCSSVEVPVDNESVPEKLQKQKTSGSPLDTVCIQQLTNAQRRVAELAALGYTNEEIGRRLFITVSTVEQHLTRVFRKLNIRSRDELNIRVAV